MTGSTASIPSRITGGPERAAGTDWLLYSVVGGSISVICGLIWDISWHRTVGRDSFWTPAHMAIYLGGILAGGSCGWRVIRATFAGTADDRATAVTFWGFRGPLGAWVCIWGAFAMLTSAPFDNWWHDAYGLDVTILSPPHAVLGMGIAGIQVGALLLALAAQNRNRHVADGMASWLYLIAAGILVTMHAVMTMEYNFTNQMHGSRFYQVAGAVFPILLIACARAARIRLPATAIAAVYMGLLLVMIWLLPLFPGEPGLAPITHPVSRMVPPHFPLLLVFPAAAIDLLMGRRRKLNDWWLAAACGIAFVAVLMAVQWYFAQFLLSPAARNPLFAAGQWGYNEGPGDWYYRFWAPETRPAFWRGMSLAMLIAAVSSRVGLWWGRWMGKVSR